jgi:hypothetical protein
MFMSLKDKGYAFRFKEEAEIASNIFGAPAADIIPGSPKGTMKADDIPPF